MVKKIAFYIFSFFIIFLPLEKRERTLCNTMLNEEQIEYEKKVTSLILPDSIELRRKITIAVTVHIITRQSEPPEINEEALIRAFESLNTAFENSNISFDICNINYIARNDLFEFVRSEESKLVKYNIENTINLYIVGKIITKNEEDVCGYTYYPTKKVDFLIISGNCINNQTTLPHEMGHYFGLYHTHEIKFGVELANEANCQAAGDLICDTPADPGLKWDNVTENCEYVGLMYDPAKNAYNPPIDNLMSYSRKGCRKHFSNDQLLKMRMNYHFFKSHLQEVYVNFFVSDTLVPKGKEVRFTGNNVNSYCNGYFSS